MKLCLITLLQMVNMQLDNAFNGIVRCKGGEKDFWGTVWVNVPRFYQKKKYHQVRQGGGTGAPV
jgi:hypothetical protein